MTCADAIVPTSRFLERYWEKVDRRGPDECWPWLAGLTGVGYGQVYSGLGRGKCWLAHRVAYVIRHGSIPDGLDLDHLCGNRACVNPAHLEPVTRQENLRRGKHVKLTRAQVRAIRAEIGTDRELGERYDVHHSTIWRIRAGVGWIGEGEPELPVAA